eukprot:GAFH01001759.1.p2 GENE.GAFH01001759.1~~GAFH01001759.1.p2  ORF type:complete len:336 (-),score=69.91 GAFH01001759.1:428-1435(-)
MSEPVPEEATDAAPAPVPAKIERPHIECGTFVKHVQIDDCKIRPELGFIPLAGLPTHLIGQMSSIRHLGLPAMLEAKLAQFDLECRALNTEYYEEREVAAQKSEETHTKLRELFEKALELARPQKPEAEEGAEAPEGAEGGEAADAAPIEEDPEPEYEELPPPPEPTEPADGEAPAEPAAAVEAPPQERKRRPKTLTDAETKTWTDRLAATEALVGELDQSILHDLRTQMELWADRQKIYADVLREALAAALVADPALPDPEGGALLGPQDVARLFKAAAATMPFMGELLAMRHIPEYVPQDSYPAPRPRASSSLPRRSPSTSSGRPSRRPTWCT